MPPDPRRDGAPIRDRLHGFARLSDFAAVTDPGAFRPVPHDWVVGLTDVENSTAASAAGRHKAVNMAGAAAICAVMNALGSRRFAFAFGGDGCAFALPAGDADLARRALAETAAFVRDDLSLSLRTALVPVADLRAAGRDVRVALYAPTPHVAYALFDGGGLALAERWMKDGRVRLDPAAPGARPDLSGLSCRFLPLASRSGAILSLIVKEGPGGGFRPALEEVLRLVDEAPSHPVAPEGPAPALISRGALLEAKASRGARPLWRRLPAVLAHGAMGFAFFALSLKAGAFDAPVYRRLAGANADVKKLSDGLMLTLDCDAGLERRLVAVLDARAAEGALRYGLHRQDHALMTCIVPSYQDDGHFHFVDGGGGGYTAAAAMMARSEAAGRS